jgi:hypothetical protein
MWVAEQRGLSAGDAGLAAFGEELVTAYDRTFPRSVRTVEVLP